MNTYLKDPTPVKFENLYLDPNNPRLACDGLPNYDDPKHLFDPSRQLELTEALKDCSDISTVIDAIRGQGWTPVDNIIIWTHPNHPDKHVVLEGNRRTVALRTIRQLRDQQIEKIKRMEDSKRSKTPAHILAEASAELNKLEAIVKDTEEINVVPISASNSDELKERLPRVLAVRHISGARPWGTYAEDYWLLERYNSYLEDQNGGGDFIWDKKLISKVADEACLSSLNATRRLKSASCFAHFKGEWTDKLPADEEGNPGEFKDKDYFLFECIVKKPWLRRQFGLGDAVDDLHLDEVGETALFEWTFKKTRPAKADDNENVFHRHQNVSEWEQMKRYDDKHKTSFASRFDTSEPESSPPYREVEAEWISAKALRQPADVIENLLKQLSELTATAIADSKFLKQQLTRLRDQADTFLKMAEAAKK